MFDELEQAREKLVRKSRRAEIKGVNVVNCGLPAVERLS
jgi:hypothetical protein